MVKAQIIKQLETKFSRHSSLVNQLVYNSIQELFDTLITGNNNISFGGENIPIARRPLSLRKSDLYEYVLSPEGAGELGFGDPKAVLTQLEDVFKTIFSTKTRISGTRLLVGIEVDFNHLLFGTPHPAKKTKSGKRIDVRSWLQWATGPQIKELPKSFALARVHELSGRLRYHSRSIIYAGGHGGLMLPFFKESHRGRFYNATGRTGEPWSPDAKLANFWFRWIETNRGFIDEVLLEISKVAIKYLIKL